MVSDGSTFFDDFFTRGFAATTKSTYPPTNIYRDNGDVTIEMAVAGFSQDELSVEFDGQRLMVTGTKATTDTRMWVYRELSSRSFTRTYALSGQYEPQPPTLVNGILSITLKGTNNKRTLSIVTGAPPPLQIE